jgi:hypothetical protein
MSEIPELTFNEGGWCAALKKSYKPGTYQPKSMAEYEALAPYAVGAGERTAPTLEGASGSASPAPNGATISNLEIVQEPSNGEGGEAGEGEKKPDNAPGNPAPDPSKPFDPESASRNEMLAFCKANGLPSSNNISNAALKASIVDFLGR